jgi:NADH-quinone oxidoreductase subunit N
VLAALLAQAQAEFQRPSIDFHAIAPELIVVGTMCLILLIDAFTDDDQRWLSSALAGVGLLVALIPVVSLAYDGVDRILFDGRYVVDDFALVLKGLFLVSGYIVVLLSTNYMAEGDYWEGEYYQLLLASILGMLVMSSARDLITVFVALELLSIPAYMLAAWRKRDARSEEAGLKYYLMGVFASAVLLYGMSLLYGVTGSTMLSQIGLALSDPETSVPIVAMGITFVLIGFGFKVSAVPFHTWAPDTYEGAPTPVTAFLSVASKTAGFVALLLMVFATFPDRGEIYEPLLWGLAAATMFVGNLIALRQTNIVRMLAYSGIAQAGYMMAPLAVAGNSASSAEQSLRSIVVYLLIYAAMNLGAFAVVMAVARKTRSGEIDSFGGLFSYAPGLAVAMTVFLFSLAGIPPLAGWFGKLGIFQALVEPGTTSGYVLAVVVGVNSVIALYYYARVGRVMWMEEVPDGDTTPIRVPWSVSAAIVLCAAFTIVVGIAPAVVSDLGDAATVLAIGS